MVSRKHYYHSIQRLSRCKDDVYVLDTINAADMDETNGTYVDGEYIDNHDHDDDDETDDVNDHKKDSYAAGAGPDAGAAPTKTRPCQARPDPRILQVDLVLA